MTIFQVWGSAGMYNDYHTWIVSSYLHKKAAQKKLSELKDKNDKEYKCLDCPYNKLYPEKPIVTDCPDHAPVNIWEDVEDKEPEYDCDNRHYDEDRPSFWIDEVEVDESEE